MSKKVLTFVILFTLLIVVGAIAAVKFLQITALIQSGEGAGPPPATVSSIKVEPYEWESILTAIGSLEASKGLVLTADLSGRVTKIHFDAGSEVNAGDLLIEQDTSVERAQLRAANSSAALAKNNFERTRKLFQSKVASKSEYDNANSTYKSALADVDNIRASIEKKSIRAPFSGRLGIRLVNLGQSIDAGQPLVSLQAADQMFVNFFLPQQDLPNLATGLMIRLTSDAVPDKEFIGRINAINPEIDATTRSVELQASVANPNKELLPGMFVNIEVVLPEAKPVLIIPITAVQYATYGDSVFVIEPQKQESTTNNGDQQQADVSVSDSSMKQKDTTNIPLIARQQFIRLGETKGDYVIVTKGLSEGESIVSMGGFKLRNGAPVVINNEVVPEFSLDPVVQDQ